MVGRGDADYFGQRLTRDEAVARNPLALRRFFGATDVRAPGGESIADVSARVARARTRILQRHPGKTVLVVSHVTPIKLFLAAALEADDGVVHRIFLEAASLSTVAWSSDGRASVRLVNDTAHLPPSRRPTTARYADAPDRRECGARS